MDTLYSLLNGLLQPLNEDDQEFVKEYWNAILKTMLTPYQRKLEADLSYNILTTQPYTKSFYESFVPSHADVSFNITSTSTNLPRNLYDLVVYGAEYDVYETVTLPCKIENATDIVCGDPSVVIDGNILLGDGPCDISYKTNIITDYTYSSVTGVFSHTGNVTRVTAKQGNGTPENIRTKCETMTGRVIYVPSITLKHAKVGQKVVVHGKEDTIAEVIDNHRFRTSHAHASAGTTCVLEIDLYPYAYVCDFDDIPEFENGWIRDIDYRFTTVGDICFCEPISESIIAKRSYVKNNDIYDRFIKHLEAKPDSEDLYLPFWRSIFTNDLEIFLYATAGYPYILFEMGNMRMSSVDYMSVDVKHSTTFTHEEDTPCKVTTEEPYFDGTELAILLDNGQFLKISRHITEHEIEVERPLFEGEEVGVAGRFTVSSMSMEDENGLVVHFRVPPGEFPLVKVGDVCEPWTELVSGVRVFDSSENYRYNSYEGTERFVVDSGVAVPSDSDVLLEPATFVIFYPEQLTVTDTILRFLMPVWAQYHKVDQRSDLISISDMASFSSVASVVFGKFLPFDVSSFVPALPVVPYLVHQAMIDPYMPMEFLGTYDGMTPEITNLKWLSGAALDISGFSDLYRVIEAFGVNPASQTAITGVHIDVTAGAAKLLIDPLTAVWPSVGVDVHFSFVAPLKMISADFTASRRGECQDALTNGEGIDRVFNGNQMYFLEEWVDCDTYIPAINSFTDIALSDETGGAFEWSATDGTQVSANQLIDTDFERLGVRSGMTYVHNTDILQVLDFDDYGQPELSGVPVHAILAADFGFYCFVARKDDGTIRKN
jgi:hypothetical protein